MNEAPPSPPADAPAHDRSAINRLLLFFALVYVVEGVGQVGGLIAQPLSFYLKQEHGWTRCKSPLTSTIFNFPWIIKPIYGVLFRFRAAVRLSPQSLSHRRQYRRGRRVPVGDAANFAEPTGLGARDHGLCHGDLEHRLRRGAGGERTTARRERPIRQSAMAVVQRRRHGGRDRRRALAQLLSPGVGAARRRRDRRRGAGCGPVRRDFSHPRAAGAHRRSGAARHASALSWPHSKNASCGSSGCFSFSITSAPD